MVVLAGPVVDVPARHLTKPYTTVRRYLSSFGELWGLGTEVQPGRPHSSLLTLAGCSPSQDKPMWTGVADSRGQPALAVLAVLAMDQHRAEPMLLHFDPDTEVLVGAGSSAKAEVQRAME